MSQISTVMLSSINFGVVQPGYDGSNSLESKAVKGAGFYNQVTLCHGVGFELNNFIGTIGLQCSLESEPCESDWSDIIETVQTYTIPYTGNNSQNFVGNYVWVRTKVTNWSTGSIIRTLLNV